MKKINLKEEKVSAKLLYLFDSDLYYRKKLYMESESGDKSSFLSTVKKIFSFIGSILTRFAFVGFLAFLVITSVLTTDSFSFILGAVMGIVFGTGIANVTNVLKSLGVEGTIKKINELLKENGYKEVDFLKVIGVCYKNSESINLNEAIKEALDIDEKNNFDNKKLKKIIKNLDSREEIEEKLLDLIKDENSNIISYLESHGFKKISVEDYVVFDNANKKTLLTKIFDNLENRYSYKEYNPEKVQSIQALRSNLELKTFGNLLTKKSGFGLKSLMNYLNNKAKTVQKYLSELLMLIISIFNPKTYSECNKTVKKEIRKIKFFLENYLKVDNKKNIFYEEKKSKEIYNENFTLPFSKAGNPGNAIKIIYRVNNHKIIINSILNEISIIGSNANDMWKQIFPNKNITGESYKWQKGEWNIIKKYIENSNANKTENTNQEENNNLNNKKNQEKIEDLNKEDLVNKEKDENLKSEEEEEDSDNLDDNDIKNKKEEKVDQSIIKKKTSYLMLMKKGIESTPVRYLIIGIIIAIPFLSLGTSTAVDMKAKFSASVLGELISKITSWLGWGTAFTSTFIGLGYIGVKKYIEKMNKKMLSDSIENAGKNSSQLENIIKPALGKIENIAEKKEKKTGIIDKAKNFFGMNKKEINDSFKYKNKKELLYNENYIIQEYFKIEKKLKKPVF